MRSWNDELLRMWIEASPGVFCVGDITHDKAQHYEITEILEYLVDRGKIERHNGRRGWYIPKQTELEPMDYKGVVAEPLDIWLPFGLSDLVELYESNVVIVSGAPNSGKTGVMLNIIKENELKGWDIYYFNSEMSASELQIRLKKFYPERALSDWKFNAFYRNEKFQDVIFPGPNCLNIIDFLEIHDEFYVIGREIKAIADRLKGGLAIIGLQKNPNSDVGLGGYRSMERTRLALALDYGQVKITKAKNFRRSDKNPNGSIRRFKLRDGCHIQETTPWRKEQNES